MSLRQPVQDEFSLLPEEERSLKLTASVEGMVTRAGDAGFWADGDTIRVRIGDYPWTDRYALNTDDSVKDAIDALAWPHTDDFVSAWYPYWKEGAEVSIQNQLKGRHAIDFLSARTEKKHEL